MNRGKRPARRSAAARVWALSVVWRWRREPDPPQVIVRYVYLLPGQVTGENRRALPPGNAT